MTSLKMSKANSKLAVFLVGSTVLFALTGYGMSQTLGSDDDGFENAIRGSIGDTNQPLVLGTDDSGETVQPVLETGQTLQPGRRATSVTPQRQVGSTDGETRSNIAAEQVQTGVQPADLDDPFAPEGFRLGTFEGNITLEQTLGYSSNVSQNVDGEGGAFSQTDVTIGLTSDWSRHQLQTNINGNYRRPFDSEEVDQLNFALESALRLDLIDGYTLTATGLYDMQTQAFTSSTLAAGAVDTPINQSFGGELELERTGHKLQLTLRGAIERNILEDADLGLGGFQSQSDRDNVEYEVSTRVGYEVSPAIVPFIEGIYGIRDFDETFDRNGNQRSGDFAELRGGLSFDLGPKLVGEVSAGYVVETFDDPTLTDLTGFTLNGQLDWSPEEDTIVSLALGTETNDSISLNDNGSIIYNGRLDYQRQINDRLSFDAFGSMSVETNAENNLITQVGMGLDYWVNRFMALTVDVEYFQFSSDAINSDFDDVNGRIGIRLQK